MSRAPVCSTVPVVRKTPVLLYQNAHWRFCKFGRHAPKTILMRKGVASLLVAPSQPFHAPKRWGSGLEHHPGAPAAFRTVLGMSRLRPGSGWKRPKSIPAPPVSVPGASVGGPRSPRSIPESFRIDFAAVRLRFGGARQGPEASATPFASLFLSPLRACSATRTAILVQSPGCSPACGLQFRFLFDVPLFLN